MRPNLLIEPLYIPNLFYFSRFFIYKSIIFNDVDVFIKQTYRNRTYILNANGVLPLIIPVKKGKTHLPFKDVEIDHHTSWARIHWQSIISAYNKSPYFFHYRDYFEKYFKMKTRFLLDFNIQLILEILKILELAKSTSLLSSFDERAFEISENMADKIVTEKSDIQASGYYNYNKYTQVFSDRFDFVPGLSVIDLIFNTGPEANKILKDGVS